MVFVRPNRGLTILELLAAIAIIMILATMIVPLRRWDEKRRREAELRDALQTMRSAIDRYNDYCQRGLITQTDVDQMGYPRTLEELADGVEVGDPQTSEKKTVKFLQQGVPENPFDGEREWGMRSYQDDWDSESWGGENVYDVYSLYNGVALDGSRYKEW